MNHSIKLLFLSPEQDDVSLYSSVCDDSLNDVVDGIDSYRSHLWRQGWDPEKEFKRKLDWTVYKINESGDFIRQGIVADFAKDLAEE